MTITVTIFYYMSVFWLYPSYTNMHFMMNVIFWTKFKISMLLLDLCTKRFLEENEKVIQNFYKIKEWTWIITIAKQHITPIKTLQLMLSNSPINIQYIRLLIVSIVSNDRSQNYSIFKCLLIEEWVSKTVIMRGMLKSKLHTK